MGNLTKKIIVSLALITAVVFASSTQASACHFTDVLINANCVEEGGGYKIKFTITTEAYVPASKLGWSYSIEYELVIKDLQSGVTIDTVNGSSSFTCTGIPEPSLYLIVQSGSVVVPECGEYELSGEVRLLRAASLTAITIGALRTVTASSTGLLEDRVELSPITVTCPCDLEGCTPGFWKNHTRFKNWNAWEGTGYDPTNDFDATFGVDLFDPDINLLQALQARGGGMNKIARHATAALLNAAHPDVEYPINTPNEVILFIQDVIYFVGGKDIDTLVNYNEYGTPGFCD